MERLICIVIGYIFGLIQSGYLYGKANHMDIRQYGSGNAGSTNVLRVMGKKAGAIVFLGDFFKAVFAMAVCRLLFKENADVDLFALYAGLGVTLGHNFPFYLKFKGGKGIACMAGIMTAMDLRITLTCFVIFSVTVFLTRYVSLGSILVSITFFAELVIFESMGSYRVSTLEPHPVLCTGRDPDVHGDLAPSEQYWASVVRHRKQTGREEIMREV